MLKRKQLLCVVMVLMVFSAASFAATLTWLGGTATIGFDSGSSQPTAGDVLTGTTSGATAVYKLDIITGGTWGGSDGAGTFALTEVSGTFVEDEIVINSTTLETNIANIDIAGSAFLDKSGDFSYGSNWTGGSPPADADELVFNGRAATVPSGFAGSSLQTPGKNYSVTEGLTQNAKNFPSIIVSDGYTGNIGYGQLTGESIYYGLRCGADDVVFGGTGDIHLIAEHTGAAGIDSFVCITASGSVFLGKGATNGQTITEVINSSSSSGSIEILEALLSTLGAPTVNSVTCTTRRGTVEIPEDNTTGVSLTITVTLGTVTAFCTTGTVTVSGGTFNWGTGDYTPASARTLTQLDLQQGTVNLDIEGAVQGIIAYDGKLTTSGSGDKTLGVSTNNNGTIEIYNATVDLSASANNVLLGSGAEVKILGSGNLLPPPFVDITWN